MTPLTLPAAYPHARLTRRAFCGLLLAGAGLALAGCARPEDPKQPPEIRYGQDLCARCGMIISDPAYAAAYRTSGGEARLFDDLGEMVLHYREQREPVATFFVHDYNTRGWVLAEQATYVQSPQLRTPMGLGVAALGSESEAQALAQRVQGRVVPFGELLERAELTRMPGAMPTMTGHG
jgi:copper chaperone NosL